MMTSRLYYLAVSFTTKYLYLQLVALPAKIWNIKSEYRQFTKTFHPYNFVTYNVFNGQTVVMIMQRVFCHGTSFNTKLVSLFIS